MSSPSLQRYAKYAILVYMTPNEIESWICPECQNDTTQYTIKVIPTAKLAPFPKYIIQIKESCASCGRYRRFAPQSDILVKRLNDRLAQIILPATGRDFYDPS